MILALALACAPDEELFGVAVLGGGTHDAANVKATQIATEDDGLNLPTDLAFDPETPGRLWVVNQKDDSVTIVHDADSNPTSEHIVDPYALHFMDAVSSIDFGAPGTFGTCQDSENTYNNRSEPNEFMGPTLWSSDLEVFATSNPEAVEELSEMFGFPVDLGSHLDMLHESPQCTGITWEEDNLYWVVDSKNGEIDRVDFREDHGVGWDDHSDGEIVAYATGELGRLGGVPSHMDLDTDSGLLWVADPGNNRVVALDTASGERGKDRRTQEPGTEHYEMDDAVLYLMIDGDDFGMEAPSGLAILGDLVFVSDYGTGRIWAFDLDGGEVDYLDVASEGLGGLEVISEDELWVTHIEANQVFRIQTAG